MAQEQASIPFDNEKLLSVIDQVLSSSQASSDSPADLTSSAHATATPPSALSGDILSSLLSNPELLAKLPRMIAAARPILNMLTQAPSDRTESEKETDAKAEPSTEDPSIPTVNTGGRQQNRRTDLLCAMKPYLKQERRDAIDKLLGLVRLGDILKML